ncbi:hypothetical protein SLEP1_g4256 [Rubroshorea leprosula]|uniref:Cyclin-D1-binding protein 1 n=1 Tax=Rubroshorea leprosula TaxID=152421 RepID=A0AAV5HNL8_9ROSI|nr:hypothetical protein SLEP1_g4256 [Rubroshorea leprosula]
MQQQKPTSSAEMGRAEKEQLDRTLNLHINTIHETFQVLDQASPSSLEKVSWYHVVQMGELLSKQATIVGMLWTGESPEAKAIEETMESYVNLLQGFLLLSHGSSVSAGPTLSSSIHESVRQVVDCSFKLLKESVSLYDEIPSILAGSYNKDRKNSIPRFVGTVWEACSALNKCPATNITAIGRAMTQVAVSVEDVLREMKELKPVSSDVMDETSDRASTKPENEPQEEDDFSEDDLGNDLSEEEMEIAQLAVGVVSGTLATVKELIRAITDLIKLENPDDNGKFVGSLEKLLKLCQEVGAQIDELGACLYPPQELPAIKVALEKISSSIDEVQLEMESFKSSSEPLVQSFSDLRTSIKQMLHHLDCVDTKVVVDKLQNVALTN